METAVDRMRAEIAVIENFIVYVYVCIYICCVVYKINCPLPFFFLCVKRKNERKRERKEKNFILLYKAGTQVTLISRNRCYSK